MHHIAVGSALMNVQQCHISGITKIMNYNIIVAPIFFLQNDQSWISFITNPHTSA